MSTQKIAAPDIRKIRETTGLSLRDAIQLLTENQACVYAAIDHWETHRLKPLRFPDLSTAKEFTALEGRVEALEALLVL